MKPKLNNLFRIVAVVLLLSLCALPVAIAPRDARAAFGDCIAYDTFTRDDGAIGNTETSGPSSEACPQYAWTGGTWAISGDKVVDTPTLGDEDISNGGFETGDPPTGWIPIYVTLSSESTIVRSGSKSVKCVGTGASPRFYQATDLTLGDWYMASGASYSDGTNNTILNLYEPNSPYTSYAILTSNSASWVYGTVTGRITNANGGIRMRSQNASASATFYNDDFSVKKLTLSTLFSSINTNSIDGTYSVAGTITAGTQAGLALLLNSQSNPTAGIIVNHDGTNLRVTKFTNATTWTSLINSAAAYAAGRIIKADVTTSAGHVYLTAYYNNVQIGTQQDITDAAIISNTYHGVFSTYSGNSLDNFYISNNIPNTATPTNTATNTATNTPTASNTPTNTPTDTVTDTPTASDTPTNTPSHTATFTDTFTITYTPTFTDTPTETYTPTASNTPTDTSTPTNTFTPTNTATLHYDATTTYEAAYAYYTGIAEQNYPTIIILSVLCGVILLALIVWGIFAYLRRRR